MDMEKWLQKKLEPDGKKIAALSCKLAQHYGMKMCGIVLIPDSESGAAAVYFGLHKDLEDEEIIKAVGITGEGLVKTALKMKEEGLEKHQDGEGFGSLEIKTEREDPPDNTDETCFPV